MSALAKILGKTKGNPVFLAGTILGILTIVIVVVTIAGAILVLGLNLMGFTIPYTVKTILGAAIVISCLRSFGGSSSK